MVSFAGRNHGTGRQERTEERRTSIHSGNGRKGQIVSFYLICYCGSASNVGAAELRNIKSKL